jgi:hypothetical protein
MRMLNTILKCVNKGIVLYGTAVSEEKLKANNYNRFCMMLKTQNKNI